MLDVR